MTDPAPRGHKAHGHGASPGAAAAPSEGAATEVRAPPEGDAGAANGLVPRVEASVSTGKLAGFDEAAAGLRPAMKACVAGKGPEGAVVELMAQIGPKGTIVRSDHVGGSEFAEGAVPCLVKLLDDAQFKKPDLDAGPPPRVTFRVKMQRE